MADQTRILLKKLQVFNGVILNTSIKSFKYIYPQDT